MLPFSLKLQLTLMLPLTLMVPLIHRCYRKRYVTVGLPCQRLRYTGLAIRLVPCTIWVLIFFWVFFPLAESASWQTSMKLHEQNSVSRTRWAELGERGGNCYYYYCCVLPSHFTILSTQRHQHIQCQSWFLIPERDVENSVVTHWDRRKTKKNSHYS